MSGWEFDFHPSPTPGHEPVPVGLGLLEPSWSVPFWVHILVPLAIPIWNLFSYCWKEVSKVLALNWDASMLMDREGEKEAPLFIGSSQWAQLCSSGLGSALWGLRVGVSTQMPFLPWVWFLKVPGDLEQVKDDLYSHWEWLQNLHLLYSGTSQIEFGFIERWRTNIPTNNKEFLPKVRTQGSVFCFLRLLSYAIVLCCPEVNKSGIDLNL